VVRGAPRRPHAGGRVLRRGAGRAGAQEKEKEAAEAKRKAEERELEQRKAKKQKAAKAKAVPPLSPPPPPCPWPATKRRVHLVRGEGRDVSSQYGDRRAWQTLSFDLGDEEEEGEGDE
jgi:hypothetical protein